MFSKFLRPTYKSQIQCLLAKQVYPRVVNRRYAEMIPASQYDIPFPEKMRMGYLFRVYWETIPLFFCTGFALMIMAGAIMWACANKVDVMFKTHNRNNISRTMDLRNPTSHKIITINQKYEPWPEMAAVIDKMNHAEKRANLRAQACAVS